MLPLVIIWTMWLLLPFFFSCPNHHDQHPHFPPFVSIENRMDSFQSMWQLQIIQANMLICCWTRLFIDRYRKDLHRVHNMDERNNNKYSDWITNNSFHSKSRSGGLGNVIIKLQITTEDPYSEERGSVYQDSDYVPLNSYCSLSHKHTWAGSTLLVQ